MLFVVVLSIATVSATVAIHAAGTSWWIRRLRALAENAEVSLKPVGVLGVLIRTALVLITLHVFEILAWALTYWVTPESGLNSIEEAAYLSFATFTTLGYGDVTLAGPWRLLTGIEALNGVLLVGWSTALSFAVIQRALASTERTRS